MTSSTRFVAIAIGAALLLGALLLASGVISLTPSERVKGPPPPPLLPGTAAAAAARRAAAGQPGGGQFPPPPDWHELPTGGMTVARDILKASEPPPTPFDRAWARRRLAGAGLRLEGVAWSEDASARIALLDGRNLRIGGTVQGFEVREIDPDAVTLVDDSGVTVRINLQEPGGAAARPDKTRAAPRRRPAATGGSGAGARPGASRPVSYAEIRRAEVDVERAIGRRLSVRERDQLRARIEREMSQLDPAARDALRAQIAGQMATQETSRARVRRDAATAARSRPGEPRPRAPGGATREPPRPAPPSTGPSRPPARPPVDAMNDPMRAGS